MKARLLIIALLTALVMISAYGRERRRISPVETKASQTQSINETANDTSRINAKKRAAAGMQYVNDNGFTVYVDTVTGSEWIDSTARIRQVPRMEYGLFHAVSAGVNIWDPVMRAFGQKYGIADAWVELSLHNRYKPVFEIGLGSASNTPSGMNYTYKSPLSVYFRVGANYNFLYNSNPDYSFFAGARYGFSPFSFAVNNITVNSPYWDETVRFDIPSQHVTAGWFELVLGLRVKIAGPISAGWAFKYQQIIHQSKTAVGEPWYIPGFGSRGSSVSGSFSIIYTLPLKGSNKPADTDVLNADQTDIDRPQTTGADVDEPAPLSKDNANETF